MKYGYERQYSSQLSEVDEIKTLLQLALDVQERGAASLKLLFESFPKFDTQITDRTQGSSIVETTRVESINTELSQLTEDNEEECIPPQETIMEEKPHSESIPMFTVFTKDSEVQDGEDFCQTKDQGDRLDGITRPADRVRAPQVKKSAFVPPAYKPPLPFPGRFKKELIEKYRALFDTQITDRTQDSSIAETTCVEPINTKPSQWTEDNKEDHIPPQETVMEKKPPTDIHLPLQKTYAVSTEDSEIQVGDDFCEKFTQGDRLDVITRPGDRVKPTSAEKPFISRKNETLYVPPPYKPPLPLPGRIKKEAVIEKNAQTKDELLLEAEECIKELEWLLGCTVDENLVIRYEEQVKPMAIMISSTKSNGEVVGVVGTIFENPCEGVMVVEHIVDKHLGIASTYELSIDEPMKIPFEEIRMKEFRGWFYDEYDPGDTWTHLI